MRGRYGWAMVLAAPVLLAAAPAKKSPLETQVDAAIANIYAPYRTDAESKPEWDRPLFTPGLKGLIGDWQKAIGEDLTALNEAGWFCECQDYSPKAYRMKRTALRELAPGKVEVKYTVGVTAGMKAPQRLILVRDAKGRWLVDDLFTESMPKGLRAGLTPEISAPSSR